MLLITAIMLVLNGSYYALLTSTAAVKPANQYAVYELIVAFGEPFCTSARLLVIPRP